MNCNTTHYRANSSSVPGDPTLLASGAVAWFAQPLLLPLFFPLCLVYYLSVGVKHRALTWHLAFWGSQLGAVAINLFWLVDWVSFWWLRSPLPHATALLPHRTVRTLWNAPIWGGDLDRAVAAFVVASAVLGIVLLNQSRQRVAARLLGLGVAGFLALALLGVAWEPLGQVGTTALLPAALFFAVVPAAHAWVRLQGWLASVLGTRRLVLANACLIGILVFLGRDSLPHVTERLQAAQPLLIGLGAEREALVEKLVQYTGPEARILWECLPESRDGPRWSPLLPLLTDRSFIGGLDPEATILHGGIGIIDQALNGRHISTWTNPALEEYCKLYNIGWIACWSPAVVNRLKNWPGASLSTTLDDQGSGFLFAVKRPVTSYTLKGQARVIHADSDIISLADVVPDNGVVVLSFHYQRGLRALPSRVQVEREPDAYDPIGFLRLRVAGPAARVTLTWDDR